MKKSRIGCNVYDFSNFFERSISLYLEMMVLKISWYQLQHLKMESKAFARMIEKQYN